MKSPSFTKAKSWRCKTRSLANSVKDIKQRRARNNRRENKVALKQGRELIPYINDGAWDII